MAGQQHLELSHKVKGQSETNAMGRAKCELKHQQDVEQEGFKAWIGEKWGWGVVEQWRL